MTNPVRKGLPEIIDQTIAFLILAVTSPVLILLGFLVKITSPGPAIFSQKRVGKNGKTFDFYKLRTMRNDKNGPKVTAKGDTRITKIGYYLRKTKLDEIPQLWNVVKGDMSIVGPRPDVPRLVDLDNKLWQKVLSTKPGITDPVALEFRDEEKLLPADPNESEKFYREIIQPFKLEGYIEYLEQRSWVSDIVLIFKSLLVFFKTNAEIPPKLQERINQYKPE